MKIVIDTNILLISIPKKSKYRPIFEGLRNGKFEIGVSTEILLEYEEKLSEKTTSSIAENVMKLLVNLENVSLQNIHFNWNLIDADKDDNKYVDCAISMNADFIVTEDKHFNVLKSINFPKVKIIGVDAFLEKVMGI